MATPPVFSAGAVLTAAQMNAVGLWQVTPTSVAGTGVSLSGSTVTASSSTTANINGCFTSDFANYRIVISQFVASGTQAIYMRLRTTTDATGLDYSFGGTYRLFVGGGGDTYANNAAEWRIATVSTTPSGGGSYDILSPNLAKHTQYLGNMLNYDSGVVVSGVHKLANAYTGITIFTGSATTFSATIRIYGYRD